MSQILLVEPDSILADLYRRGLETVGHNVLICAGAQSAIHSADVTKPDVVILELQLVEHSGIEFLYEFRSYPEWQAIPVLVLSGIPPNEFSGSHDLLMNELGVRAYHYKPLTSLSNLLLAIDQVVRIVA